MSPEREVLDQLLGGDMPLAVIRGLFDDGDRFARSPAAKGAGDGGVAGRSRLDDARMDHDARRSTAVRHHLDSEEPEFAPLVESTPASESAPVFDAEAAA